MLSHYISTVRSNLKVFGALIALTLATALSDYINLGPFNLIVALLIAGTKATLVVIFFMHLRFSGRITWAFVGLAVVFLAILIGMTFDDVITRHWIPQPQGWTTQSSH